MANRVENSAKKRAKLFIIVAIYATSCTPELVRVLPVTLFTQKSNSLSMMTSIGTIIPESIESVLPSDCARAVPDRDKSPNNPNDNTVVIFCQRFITDLPLYTLGFIVYYIQDRTVKSKPFIGFRETGFHTHKW